MRRTTPSRRRILRTLAATGAATLVDPGPVLARLVAQQPCADPATAGTLVGTLPLFRAGCARSTLWRQVRWSRPRCAPRH